MVLRYLSGVLLFVLLLASPAAARAPHRDAAWSFSIDVPADWTTSPPNDEYVRLNILAPGRAGLCNITAENHPGGTVATETMINGEYLKSLDPKVFFNELPPSMPVTDATSWSITLGSHRAIMGEGTAELTPGIPTRFLKIWLLTPRRSYNVNCLARVADYPRMKPVFEKLMKSFRVDQAI